jgi:hypothetical protein
MHEASSEHIKRIGLAISIGSANRPNGVRLRKTLDWTGSLITNQSAMPDAVAAKH